MSGTFNKHLSLAIFDKHLVRQTNQGWPKILPQYPLETALTVTLIWQLNNNLPNSYKSRLMVVSHEAKEEVPCDGLSTNAREYFTRTNLKKMP